MKKLLIALIAFVGLLAPAQAHAASAPAIVGDYAQATITVAPYSGINTLRVYAQCNGPVALTYQVQFDVNVKAGFNRTYLSPCDPYYGTKRWTVTYKRVGGYYWLSIGLSVCNPPWFTNCNTKWW